MENEAKISCKIFCNANAIAIQPIPKLASRGAISTHKFIKTNKTAIIHITILIINLTIFFVISIDFSSAPPLSLVISTVKNVLNTLLAQKTIKITNNDDNIAES
jgi:hypothetical protein